MKTVIVLIHLNATMEVFDFLSTLCRKYPNFQYQTISNHMNEKGAYRKDGIRIERKRVIK